MENGRPRPFWFHNERARRPLFFRSKPTPKAAGRSVGHTQVNLPVIELRS